MSKKKGKSAVREAPKARGQGARKPAAKSRGLRLTLTAGESSALDAQEDPEIEIPGI